MSQEKVSDKTAEFEISNIGGIDHSTATLEPGVAVLTGKNATNRTSLLQAIMAACGSEAATLKADADEGRVELTMGGETYTRTLIRQNGTVRYEGSPYTDDPTLADLYAFLFENNEARQAVSRSDDLREIIMRPVDTTEIEREIRELEAERNDIDAELQRLDSLRERLPELETEKQRLEDEIADKETALEDRKEEIETLDADVEETRDRKEKHEATIDELSKKRQELQNVKRRIESERESIESLDDEREELTDELNGLDEVSGDRIAQIDQEIQRLRGQIQGIDSTVGDLQSVIQFNEEFLDGRRPDFLEELEEGGQSNGAITDKLVDDTEEIVCWTCGSEVETDQIEATLDRLQTFRNDRMNDRQALQDQISNLQDEKSTLEKQQRKRERIQQKLAEVETEIDDRKSTLEDLEERKEAVSEAVDSLGDEVDELEEAEQSKILDVQKEASRLEVEIDRLEADVNDVEDEIAEIESKLTDQEDLEQRRNEITSELTDLRTLVEDLQQNAIEEFNEHMDAVLELLDYENLERIWIERTRDEVREGRQTTTKDRFALHIVRSTDSGTVYEDTVDHLSESEREVTGLVFALAGYLVHDVYDEIPFMLLDSIEAIDSDRIARLVDYLASYADYLVVALLEEDASALDDSYPRIESI
jgi:chromosome segregation ATPase